MTKSRSMIWQVPGKVWVYDFRDSNHLMERRSAVEIRKMRLLFASKEESCTYSRRIFMPMWLITKLRGQLKRPLCWVRNDVNHAISDTAEIVPSLQTKQELVQIRLLMLKHGAIENGSWTNYPGWETQILAPRIKQLGSTWRSQPTDSDRNPRRNWQYPSRKHNYFVATAGCGRSWQIRPMFWS